MAERIPSLFLGHGAPLLALDASLGEPLRRLGERLPRPRGILAVSAHWEESPLTLGTTEARELIYDFSGFPEALYRVRYPAPGAPWLADRVFALLKDRAPRRSQRGLDHGVWTPLVHLYPSADVPLLQISMPRSDSPADLFELGRALAPLRDEGVLILGTGNVTHNLRKLDWQEHAATPQWAKEFDLWISEVLTHRDREALVDYQRRAPHLALAQPTDDHLRPLLVAAGAGSDEPVSFPIEGWEYGSLSRRSVQFG
jgi:4,5-DOPA dioxygenase extradiol